MAFTVLAKKSSLHHVKLTHTTIDLAFSWDDFSVLIKPKSGNCGLREKTIAHHVVWLQDGGLMPRSPAIFERHSFHKGTLLLTLWRYPSGTLLNSSLLQTDCIADLLCIGNSAELLWDEHTAKLLSRLCRWGTVVQDFPKNKQQMHTLEKVGFTANAWLPLWLTLPKAKVAHPKEMAISVVKKLPKQNKVTVIGGGLGGACVAWLMAIRGWQVTVLDAANQPASGASGVPVGLFGVYHSKDDSALHRLTTHGVQATLQLLRDLSLQEEVDWGTTTDQNTGKETHWVHVPQMVNACLQHPNITWQGNCVYIDDKDMESQQQNVTSTEQEIEHSHAQLLIFCNAHGVKVQLPTIPLQQVKGQVLFGKNTHQNPIECRQQPPNGNYIQTPTWWLTGATYHPFNAEVCPQPLQSHVTAQDTARNWQRLQFLAPHLLAKLALDGGESGAKGQDWAQWRCHLPDRLPVVGKIGEGSWVCTGFASRGLSLAALSAQLLVAIIQHEPLPLPKKEASFLRVSRFLDANRTAWRN